MSKAYQRGRPGDVSSAQDVYCCDLCKRPDNSLVHCDVCHVNLCKTCVGEHAFDKSQEHRIVTFENRGFTCNFPKCKEHPSKICESYCKLCRIPICVICFSSKHAAHERCDILISEAGRKQLIQNDLLELKNIILPKYQKAASALKNMKDKMCKQFQKLKENIKTQGEFLHREVDNIVQDTQTKIDDIESKTMANANIIETSINETVNQISKHMENLKGLLNLSFIRFLSAYKPQNEKYRKPPPTLQLSVPKFTPGKINREQINQQIGFLENLALNTGMECSWKLEDQFIDEPRILINVTSDTPKSTVACLSNDEFWTCGENKVATLHKSLQEIKSLNIKSISDVSDVEDVHVAVTLEEALVFASSRFIFKHTLIENSYRPRNDWKDNIQRLITLSESIPLSVCCTSSGDLLVIMSSHDKKQTKVVRFSGSEEKQTIQWDDQWKPLYSSGGKPDIKYITENKNFDICVADNNAKAVVVVSGPGKLRFRYLGVHFSTEETFDPFGITTDSRKRILIADKSNHRIHILDQDGQFLRYIYGWKLRCPRALCIDSKDSLFVTLNNSVQKIRYYE